MGMEAYEGFRLPLSVVNCLWHKRRDAHNAGEVRAIEGINFTDLVRQHGCGKLEIENTPA
jgi:hypothetical protein